MTFEKVKRHLVQIREDLAEVITIIREIRTFIEQTNELDDFKHMLLYAVKELGFDMVRIDVSCEILQGQIEDLKRIVERSDNNDGDR